MKLVFLPHVREGIAPTSSAGAHAQASVGVRLESPGRQARDVSRVMTLLGPGDVVAIERRQVLRVTPASGTRDAEPEFFPSIEFDAPDLPWTYSPIVPSGTRVLPWMVLIVVEATPEGYREKGRLEVLNRGAQTETPPSFAEGTIFVRNDEEVAAVVAAP